MLDLVSFEVGVCMVILVMIVYCCVIIDGDIKDKYVLVMGGLGWVGYYVI